MGKLFCVQYYENIILNNIIFLFLFVIIISIITPTFTHQNTSGHTTSIDNFKIIGREENNLARTIQEAMFIRVNNPTLNRNIGKYNLPHIWDRILFTIPELKMNK